ncbi:hypothetical protein NMY3_02635 [Candidatus Nitrosocosmicus oleophilus]|jgi:hypothetical protein|uniref:Uncharacterized protein n=1 Tax=Candidatus Nitrosocosmicus oleophilus TaxID=1353260 RepID=A0A654M2E9_9ARCH|nr:hypothetical protein [Candidatus Nitrosocosmicus oleophilus]ALI36826.1 hypothetical protein NMY3_02635 [Candidatus Nitrosocosmicus oleophilus]
MRLPLKEKGKNPDTIILLNKFYENIKDVFENSIRANIVTVDTKVMLADFSVIDISSFDPNKIVTLFQNFEKMVNNRSKNWQSVPIQSTKSDDIRRLYFQVSLEVDKFYFYIYMGIQFHSLLYYQVDKQVIQISKQIRELQELNNSAKSEITLKGDQIIKNELEKLGYKDVDNTQLFEELFTHTDLSNRLIEKASSIEGNYPEMERNIDQIAKLKKDLENLIIETFHIDLASLDQNKMLQGENGMVLYVDFEMIKNKKTKEKTSVINFEKIPKESTETIKNELDFLYDLMKNELKA